MWTQEPVRTYACYEALSYECRTPRECPNSTSFTHLNTLQVLSMAMKKQRWLGLETSTKVPGIDCKKSAVFHIKQTCISLAPTPWIEQHPGGKYWQIAACPKQKLHDVWLDYRILPLSNGWRSLFLTCDNSIVSHRQQKKNSPNPYQTRNLSARCPSYRILSS